MKMRWAFGVQLLVLCGICAATALKEETYFHRIKLTDGGNSEIPAGMVRVFSNNGAAFEAVGHSYGVSITMNPPQGLTGTFRASVSGKDGSRKSCTLNLVNNALSCQISHLRPNSTYTVSVESCPQGGLCSSYGNNYKIRTMPGVPRYVTVAHRDNTACSVSWYNALEDANGHYLYKLRAVEVGGSQTFTCDPRLAGNFQSCQLSGLKSGWKYEVSVSACNSENFCSDYSSPIIAETLPKPPFGQVINEAHPDSLDTAFYTPQEEVATGRYLYMGTLEPLENYKGYTVGCDFQVILCQNKHLAAGTKYNFRVFACNKDSLLCSEGTPVVVETYPSDNNAIVSLGTDSESVYVSWNTNKTVATDGASEFEVRVSNFLGVGPKMRFPVGQAHYAHTFRGIRNSDVYDVNLDLCTQSTCSGLSSGRAMTLFKAGGSFQVDDVTQTTAHISWTQPFNELHTVQYYYVYAVPVDTSLGQQQCVSKDRKVKECTLQNLKPDTEYNIMSKTCINAATCSYLTQETKIRTAKPVTMSTPTDVQAVNGKTTSFVLTWTQPQGGNTDTIEYRVTLTAPGNPEIPERTVVCEATSANGKQVCQLEDLDKDMLYSATVSACVTDDVCTEASKPITFKTAAKAFEAVAHSHSVSVRINSPEASTTKFRASVSRKDGSQKSCELTLVDNVLSCEISKLQPYSTYTVALEACSQDGDCFAYGDKYDILTLPGVPRYVTVAYRTNSTYTVSWYNALEDPNGHYLYKLRAVEVDGSQTITCAPRPAGKFQSCQLSGLKSGWKYEVSVSACTSENFCGDHSSPVLAETLPNPPFGQAINEAHPDSLDTAFYAPQEEVATGRYLYTSTLEPLENYKGYTVGCGFQVICQNKHLAAGTKYNFRVFACNKDSLLCSEGTPVVVETYPSENNVIYPVGADSSNVYVSWRSTLTVTNDGFNQFEVRVSDFLGRGQKMRFPVGKEQYNHTFRGIGHSDLYDVNLDLCNETTCRGLSSRPAMTLFKGAEAFQVTNITQTTAHITWKQPFNELHTVQYTYVYAVPVDKSVDQQQCVSQNWKVKECTLQNLRPDTEYNIMSKSCINAATCSYLTSQKYIRTAIPGIVSTPTDVTVVDGKPTSCQLSWTKPNDIADAIEYKVSLTTPDHPEIPAKMMVCEITSVGNKYTCQLENLYTDVSYSATVLACVTDGYCAKASRAVTFKTTAKDGYVLKSTSVEPLTAYVSWTSDRAKADSEFRVLVDSSSTPMCTVDATAGTHTCQVKGLLPSSTHAVKLTECTKSTNVCEDLYILPIQTASGESIYELLRVIGEQINKATTEPEDPISQLMIRVPYSKLAVPVIGSLRYVSAVITPTESGSVSNNLTWSAPSKGLEPVGGTYVNPIHGSWEVRLPMPQTQTRSVLPDQDVVLGSGHGVLTDSHNYDGQLTAATSYQIQLRVYTDLGFGTTAPVEMSTSDVSVSGGLIAVSVIFAVLCVLLIALIVILVPIVRKDKIVFSQQSNEKDAVSEFDF